VETRNWAEVGERRPEVQNAMLAKLAEPGGVGLVLCDAYWEKPNAYRRPFAGMLIRGFARGAARLARLAQCPIVPFVAVLGRNRYSVRIEWGEPIEPVAQDVRGGDEAVLDVLLDWLERAVGRYPTQYLHPMGGD
jgi:lauroyl/myristoyl acyltransferase